MADVHDARQFRHFAPDGSDYYPIPPSATAFGSVRALAAVCIRYRGLEERNYTKRLTNPLAVAKVYHMVDYRSEPLDHVFKALGDPTRRRMVGSLSAQERSVSELAEPLKMTLAAASKHIRVLERAGLVRRSKRGRTHYIRLDPGPLATAHSWLDVYRRLWDEQFDKLDAYLAGKKKRGEKPNG
jgi:DNA-binding transcriptional ArsR family regulator